MGYQDEDEAFWSAIYGAVFPYITLVLALWVCLPIFFGALSGILDTESGADGPAGVGAALFGALLGAGLALALGAATIALWRNRPRGRFHLVLVILCAAPGLAVSLRSAIDRPAHAVPWLAAAVYFAVAVVAIDRLRRKPRPNLQG